MSEEPKTQRWWQTVPGILTAIAGIITAVTGLIVAVQQTGIFDTALTPDHQTQRNATTPPATTEPFPVNEKVPEAVTPSDTGQTIQMPDGRSVTMSFAGNKFQYTILSAQRELIPPDKYSLRFRIRVWTDSSGGVNFWSDSFRLYVGDKRIKPTNDLNELVSRDETKEEDIEFEIDSSIKEATLVITVGGLNFSGNTKQLRLVFS